MIVGQGPTALAVGAGGGCLDIFTIIFLFSPLSPSLWETARYRLKYCLKGPLNPRQHTNQILWLKKYETDFRTKYADKNPFIKETETEINIQTYPQRRPGRNKSPQGRNLNNPDRPQRRELNNGFRPRNNFTIPRERPPYSEIVQQRRQQQPKRILRQGTRTEGKTLYT